MGLHAQAMFSPCDWCSDSLEGWVFTVVFRPRIGEQIRVAGKTGRVVSILRVKDIIYGMSEVEAQVFGDNQKSMLGRDWLKLFYRVGIRGKEGGIVEWFDCHDIEEAQNEDKSG